MWLYRRNKPCIYEVPKIVVDFRHGWDFVPSHGHMYGQKYIKKIQERYHGYIKYRM